MAHGDLRPSNIHLVFPSYSKTASMTAHKKRQVLLQIDFTKDSFEVRIANFSHARLLTEEPERLNIFAGTSHYHSPQVLSGEQSNSRDDIWALGCILCELVSGHTPFQGENQQEQQLSIEGSAY